eukprot:116030-Amphidinium_carterae.2
MTSDFCSYCMRWQDSRILQQMRRSNAMSVLLLPLLAALLPAHPRTAIDDLPLGNKKGTNIDFFGVCPRDAS